MRKDSRIYSPLKSNDGDFKNYSPYVGPVGSLCREREKRHRVITPSLHKNIILQLSAKSNSTEVLKTCSIRHFTGDGGLIHLRPNSIIVSVEELGV
jgi:hypothetical protein